MVLNLEAAERNFMRLEMGLHSKVDISLCWVKTSITTLSEEKLSLELKFQMLLALIVLNLEVIDEPLPVKPDFHVLMILKSKVDISWD